MVRAVGYARYSTDRQREESVEAQLKYIRDYAETKNIAIIGEYIDRGISGRRADERESFMQMIKDSRNGNFELVLVHKSNRFARNREESALYKHKLKKNGVQVIAVAQDFGEGPHTVIMEALMEGLDEFYSLELANETMKGLIANAEKCKYNGGRVLYGYKVNDKSEYELEPQEAKVVKKIYDMFIDGYSYNYILSYLNEHGIKTKAGKNFSKSSIYEMLRNEKYTGVYIFNKTPRRLSTGQRNNRIKNPDSKIIKVPGGIPQIITKEKWLTVQESLDKNKRKTNPKNRKFLLTGFIKCGICGYAYTGNTITTRGKKRGYYSCNSRKNNLTCHNKNVNQEIIEHEVQEQITEIVNLLDAESILAEVNNFYARQDKESCTEKQRLESEVHKLNGRIDNLLTLVEEGDISNAIKSRLKENIKLKDRIETTLRQISVKQKPINSDQLQQVIKNLLPKDKTFEQKRAIFQKIGLRVIVYPDNVKIVLGEENEEADCLSKVHVASPTPTLDKLIIELIFKNK